MAAGMNGRHPVKDLQVIANFLLKRQKESSKNGSLLMDLWSVAEESDHTSLCGTTPLERAEVRQWIEYVIVKISSSSPVKKNKMKEILQELDSYLMHHTYMVGGSITLADVVLYFTTYSHLLELSVQERSKFTSVGRWFNLIQECDSLRPKDWETVVFLVNINLL